jgi:hypothetical protein
MFLVGRFLNLLAAISGTAVLLRFWLRHHATMRALPPAMANPDVLAVRLADGRPFSVASDTALPDAYNADLAAAKRALLALHSDAATGGRNAPRATMALFFSVRLATIAVLCAAPSRAGLAAAGWISLLQFAVAPYSLVIAVAQAAALFLPLFIGHFLSLGAMIAVARCVPATAAGDAVAHYGTIRVDAAFIVLFFAADLALCVRCLWRTPLGASQPPARGGAVLHVAYGLLNSKTYPAVLLLAARAAGFRFNAAFLLADALLGVTPALNATAQRLGQHWAPLFYHQHRVAHLPVAYDDAHKFHHHLHDTNAFAAHLYGSGAPEEYVLLAIEVAGCVLLGVPPPTLNYYVLQQSWSNKIGHTRKVDGSGGCNHHADHHTVHVRNFGIYNALVDMHFGTNHPSNDAYEFGGYTITRRVGGRLGNGATEVSFDFVPKAGGGRDGIAALYITNDDAWTRVRRLLRRD